MQNFRPTTKRPWCLPELKVHETVGRVSQLLKAEEGQVKVVYIATARWVGACHSCASTVKLQAWAAVCDMDVYGVVRLAEQPHGLQGHNNQCQLGNEKIPRCWAGSMQGTFMSLLGWKRAVEYSQTPTCLRHGTNDHSYKLL